jgi:hypothetical protein
MPRARKVCSHNAPVPCGSPAVRDGRCDVHAKQHDQERPNRHERGYGSVHTKATGVLKIKWLAAARRGAVWWCARCEQPLIVGQPVDGDHWRSRPPAAPDRLAHAACNRGKRLPTPQGRYKETPP